MSAFYDEEGRFRGFEDIANRATAESVLKQWQDVVLKQQKEWLKKIVTECFYKGYGQALKDFNIGSKK